MFPPSPKVLWGVLQLEVVDHSAPSSSILQMAAEVARLRAEVAVLRGHAAGRSPSSRGEGGDFAASLALNEQLEGRLRRLQEQLGRLRQ